MAVRLPLTGDFREVWRKTGTVVTPGAFSRRGWLLGRKMEPSYSSGLANFWKAKEPQLHTRLPGPPRASGELACHIRGSVREALCGQIRGSVPPRGGPLPHPGGTQGDPERGRKYISLWSQMYPARRSPAPVPEHTAARPHPSTRRPGGDL